ncbi:gastric inhibitory polypeptide receptor-like isoform X2 [Sinocyclocheilus rhinocerous]|uniref:Gastric inhibitory polypeptide receptor-like n=1 Tax=Sinocyclocheilus rhinocerous TaxID=307959 RepID=A0A673HNI0_9TELE|nr:PREDICTED: gastric inhibitory polypeptide receptor-like isoform X2 [Sinocyclocheilus rhinocerous]
MKSTPTIFLLTLAVLCRAESVSGKTVKDTVQEWNRYRNECIMKISSQPTPSVRNGFVSRECGPDGQWLTVNDSRTWRDHSQCNADDNQEKQENQMMILAYFRVMYTVGYSLSLASLSLALVILLLFRKLRCTRNYIHTNLFASFILRAVSILTRDALLMKDAPEFRDNKDVSIVLSDQVMSGCRVAQVLMQYCVGANYYWLLVEGLYLHNLLVVMVFSENSYFCVYLFIGWGTPVLFVVPWIVVRYLYENTRCWEINENMAYWWIIRTPILLAILVNFFIFIRIIQILVSKLKAHQMRYTDYKFRLAKSTLTLIPLLGIHEVVFAVMAEEQTEGLLRNVNLFFELFFNSFQGFLVAILYCFVNKEVQSEIKKKWQRWKLGISILEDQRNTGSNTQQGGAGPRCHHDPACSPDCPLDSGSQLSSDPTPTNTQLAVQHHYHPGAKKGKAYCYISARKQVLNGLDVPALPHCAGEGAVTFSENYC